MEKKIKVVRFFSKRGIQKQQIQEFMEMVKMQGITVSEFCGLYISQYKRVEIWSNKEATTVFTGTFKDAGKSKYADCEVTSFDIEDNIFVVNID